LVVVSFLATNLIRATGNEGIILASFLAVPIRGLVAA
jgi:hypothetical protein